MPIVYTHSNLKCHKILFAGMGHIDFIGLVPPEGFCSATDIPVPRFIGLFSVHDTAT